ncbi:MAG: Ig-like domain-containing protein [Candidatus Thorarchaeota archaeon]
MDGNYDWSDGVFRDGAGGSLNLAVNVLADVLHTIAVEVGDVDPPTVLWTTPGDLKEDVSVGEDVVIAFSEAVDASSFGFTVSPRVGDWNWTWSAGGTKMTGNTL